MKNYIFLLAVLTIGFVSCSDDDEQVIIPKERGTVTDDEGNEYEWVRIGDLDWTTSNAQNGSPCYDASYPGTWGDNYVFEENEVEYMIEEYMPEYGNLMTFEDAMDSAPEGWRLPTDEDWKNLERNLGMGTDINAIGWRTGAAKLMMQKEEGTTLNMLLGGGIIWTASYYLELKFMHFKEYGYYWTSTIDESYKDFQAAYYRKLCFGKDAVERRATKTSRLMSVRWVRDAE
ncbi:MAG: fibrobacter succinogenes major paralogous domain-containing protein [Bacteroides sp.]|nr:fibrobacter succinogenes major paralogous domain-containing protein [Roseburia sp.]MCM1346566.1 fibrobacter succinogenes major paralogous domain-containing protein [Bacteroides sp.]MCM1420556.1 fibrobacter succinogenes major paralogous domain-containing protein [Bacteroides sp.]